MSKTLPKIGNFFIAMNHIFCTHNFKLNFQTSIPRLALNLSRPEGHGKRAEG